MVSVVRIRQHAPFFDVQPRTGVSIEEFYADRALETFGSWGAGWFWWARQRAMPQPVRRPVRLLRATRSGKRAGPIQEYFCSGASTLLPRLARVEAEAGLKLENQVIPIGCWRARRDSNS